MDESLRAEIQTQLSHLNGLIRRGQQLRDRLESDPADGAAVAATRDWHEHCGVTINQLSGGSKAHWLAKSFSGAFLKRSEDGRAVEGAEPGEIVKRLLDVLDQAVASLAGMGMDMSGSTTALLATSSLASPAAPPPRRFEFVHNAELRPVV